MLLVVVMCCSDTIGHILSSIIGGRGSGSGCLLTIGGLVIINIIYVGDCISSVRVEFDTIDIGDSIRDLSASSSGSGLVIGGVIRCSLRLMVLSSRCSLSDHVIGRGDFFGSGGISFILPIKVVSGCTLMFSEYAPEPATIRFIRRIFLKSKLLCMIQVLLEFTRISIA